MRTRVPSFGQTFLNKVGPCQKVVFVEKTNQHGPPQNPVHTIGGGTVLHTDGAQKGSTSYTVPQFTFAGGVVGVGIGTRGKALTLATGVVDPFASAELDRNRLDPSPESAGRS